MIDRLELNSNSHTDRPIQKYVYVLLVKPTAYLMLYWPFSFPNSNDLNLKDRIKLFQVNLKTILACPKCTLK